MCVGGGSSSKPTAPQKVQEPRLPGPAVKAQQRENRADIAAGAGNSKKKSDLDEATTGKKSLLGA